jgi:hypothetical protein
MKNDLIESCLADLRTRGKIFTDRDDYIPEVKIKEIFFEIFPNFDTKTLNQFLVVLENKRKASKLNYYQDSYNLNEIIHKIREGESYRQEDLSLFKSTMRIVVDKTKRTNKKKNKFNGQLLGYGASVFK